MFKESFIIKIKDGYFHYIDDKDLSKSKKFYMPYSIYKDGEILNYHHFFYKFKKMIEILDLDKNANLILLLESSKFKHFNFEIPKLKKDDEILNFLKIELEDYPNVHLDQIKIFYKSKVKEDKLLLSVDLVDLKLIETLKKITTKLEIKNIEFFPENHIFKENGTYVEIGTHFLKKIEVKDNLVFSVKKVYNENLEELIKNNGLETKNVENILMERYEPEENKIDEDFLYRYENYFLNQMSFFESIEVDNIYLIGDLIESRICEKINDFLNKDFVDGNNLLKYDFNTPKKEKTFIKTENILNYVIVIGVIIIFAYNAFNIKHLNDNIKNLESIKVNPKIETAQEDYSSDKYQTKNKYFVKLISEIQSLEDSNFFITRYLFDEGEISIDGVVKDENYLNEKLKNYKITYKNMYVENGFNKFQIKIKND